MIKNISLFLCLSFWALSSQAMLIGRLEATPGAGDFQAYYDTDADLTWLADANYAQTSGYDEDGLMTWQQSMDWAAGLTVGGVNGWRLPNTIDVGNDGPTFTNVYEGADYGYNITTHSELSNMFYNVLGNIAVYDTSPSGFETNCAAEGGPDLCLTNTGPFTFDNIWRANFFSATEYAPNTNYAWYFRMKAGDQGFTLMTNSLNAWAVQSGDVSAVPIPAAVWLFGSGLLGLIGFARRK